MTPLSAEALTGKAKLIKVVIMHLDGVLTAGHIVYGDYGDEIKFFDVQDGLGLSLLHRANIKTVVLSARKSRINHRRAKELKIGALYQKVDDKLAALQKIIKNYKVSPEEICFIGNDLVDRPVMTRVGLAVAVANAVPEIKEVAHYIAHRPGGRGAVREVADLILKGLGLWAELTAEYYR